jgi:hypothetical protein
VGRKSILPYLSLYARYRFFSKIVCTELSLLTFTTIPVRSQTVDHEPTTSPDKSEERVNDSLFGRRCLDEASKTTLPGYKIVRTETTHNSAFGLIWRADLESASSVDRDVPIRIICWKKEKMYTLIVDVATESAALK